MWSQTLLKLPFLKPKIAGFYTETHLGHAKFTTVLYIQDNSFCCNIINPLISIQVAVMFVYFPSAAHKQWISFALYNLRDVFSQRMDRGLFITGGRVKYASVQSNSGESPAIKGVFLLSQSDEIVEVNRRTASGLWVIWPCPAAYTGPLSQKSEILSKTAAVIKPFSVCPSPSKTLQLQYLLWVRPTSIYN